MTPFPGDGPTTIFGSTDADDSDGRGPLQYHEARGRTEGQLDDDEEWESDVSHDARSKRQTYPFHVKD